MSLAAYLGIHRTPNHAGNIRWCFLEIKRAFGLFHGPAWYAVDVDHRGSHVAVAE